MPTPQRKPQQPKVRSHVAQAAHNRKSGVHADQKRRTDSKAIRRDRSWREDY